MRSIGIDKNKWILGVKLVEPYEMFCINRRYKQNSKTTDVLSFRQYECEGNDINSLRTSKTQDDPNILGQIYICLVSVIHKNRIKTFYESPDRLEREIRKLLIHGLCHLAGFDHQTYREYLKMRTIECAISNAWCHKIKSIYPLMFYPNRSR